MSEQINPALTGKRAEGAALWAESEWRDVATFIGPNAHKFEVVWVKTRVQSMAKGAGFKIGWCWPPLFIGFAWFLYRKMWGFGALLLVVPVVVGYLLPGGGAIGLGVAFAMMAKSIYVQHAVVKIAKLRARGAGDAEIAAAGGVSVAGGIIGGVILGVAVLSVIAALALGVPAEELR